MTDKLKRYVVKVPPSGKVQIIAVTDSIHTVLHNCVEGYLESMPIPKSLARGNNVCFANEDGYQMGLERNPIASHIYRLAGGLADIVGSIVLCRLYGVDCEGFSWSEASAFASMIAGGDYV